MAGVAEVVRPKYLVGEIAFRSRGAQYELRLERRDRPWEIPVDACGQLDLVQRAALAEERCAPAAWVWE